jgi:hypothetical protein
VSEWVTPWFPVMYALKPKRQLSVSHIIRECVFSVTHVTRLKKQLSIEQIRRECVLRQAWAEVEETVKHQTNNRWVCSQSGTSWGWRNSWASSTQYDRELCSQWGKSWGWRSLWSL